MSTVAGPQICGRVHSSLRSFFSLPSSANTDSWLNTFSEKISKMRLYPGELPTQLGRQNATITETQIEAGLYSCQLSCSRCSRVPKGSATKSPINYLIIKKYFRGNGSPPVGMLQAAIDLPVTAVQCSIRDAQNASCLFHFESFIFNGIEDLEEVDLGDILRLNNLKKYKKEIGE